MSEAGNRLLRPGKAATLGVVAAAALLACVTASARASDTFTQPTKEELEMKSLPGYPNAPAVMLNQEEITKDDLHVVQHYERIKILTDEGKKYANVELKYVSRKDMDDSPYGDGLTVDTIQGRTIHADGTVIPFTGKPYLKMIENAKHFKVQEKVFTLPDVEVGSIIEYRYATRISDMWFESPAWILQGDLYVVKAHYMWYPTSHELGDEDGMINTIHWFPILRPQDKFEHRETPGTGAQIYELTAKDVPPLLHEEFMPPLRNFSYRVMFSYTAFRSEDEFWNHAGKRWSKEMNSFAGPNGALRDATQKVIAGASTDDEKLKKIYAAVMELENTEFTRERDKREDKANGQAKLNNAADVLTNKRGTPTQLALLFIGMARAAGLQASAVLVPDRSTELAAKGFYSLSQFDDVIAVVKVGGKDEYFDPGSRYQPYGHLDWRHTLVTGLRQTDNGGAVWAQMPEEPFTANAMFRVANLDMDDHGQISGTITMTYNGAPAVRWRQAALRGDEESVHKQLEESLQEMIPKSLEAKVTTVTGLEAYNDPLKVNFKVNGGLGTMAGKRMLLPMDLFNAGASATFPHDKRDIPVYFHYPQNVRDALRINLPANLTPEAVPDAAKFTLTDSAVYGVNVQSTPRQFTTRRDFACNTVIVMPNDYPKLRAFYSQFEAKDQESVVLNQTTAQASAATPAVPATK